VDTNPDRTYAVLPAGVPKEWIALHYKSEKKRKAQKKQASAQCAAAIASPSRALCTRARHRTALLTRKYCEKDDSDRA